MNGASVGTDTAGNGGDWSGGDGAALATRGAANMGGLGNGSQNVGSFDGQIGIFRVYRNEVLTATEIANNYAAVKAANVFSDTNGDWGTSTNWDTDLSPTSGQDAFIGNGNTIGASLADEVAKSLTVGHNEATLSGAGTLNVTAGDLTLTNDLAIGVVNNGTVNVSGGAVSVGGNVTDGAGNSTLNLTGGSLDVGGTSLTVDQLAVRGGTLTSVTSATLNGGAGVGNNALVLRDTTVGFGITLSDNILWENTNNGTGTISGNVDLDGGTRTINVQQGTATTDLEISGIVSNGGLRKEGDGTLLLSGINTYSGITDITDGSVIFTDNSAFGSSSLVRLGLVGGNTQDLEYGVNGLTLSRPVQIQNSGGNKTLRLDLAGTNTGTLSGTLDIRRTAAGQFDVVVGADDTLTVSGNVVTNAGGGAGIFKTGDGTLVLDGAGANSYSGPTTVDSGVVLLSKPNNVNAIPAGGAVAVTSGAKLSLDGHSQISDGVSSFTITSGTFDAAGFVEGLTPQISLTNGTIDGTAGGFILARGGYLGTGTNTINKRITSRAANANSAIFDIQSGTTTVNAAIFTDTGGASGMTKNGAGTLTLTSTNTYTGATTVNAGTLLVDGSTASGSAVTVNSMGTLGGTGTVGGAVIVAGTLGAGSPLSTVEDLATGSLTFTGGSFDVQVGADGNTTPGTSNDTVNVTGAVALGAGVATLNVSSLGTNPSAATGVYTLIDNDGTDSMTDGTTGFFAGLVNGAVALTAGGTDFKIFYNGGDGNDVVLVEADTPTTIYVNDDWTSAGMVDGDLETTGTFDTAYVGVNAFASIDAALAMYPNYAGPIIVNGGDYSGTNANLTGGSLGDITLQFVQDLTNSETTVTIDSLNGDANDAANTSLHGNAVGLVVNDGTFAGTISGLGSLTKAGSGTLTLNGDLNHTGDTVVNGGIVQLNQSGVGFPGTGGTGQFGSAHTVTVNNGATLEARQDYVFGDGLQNKVVVNETSSLAFINSDNYLGNIELTGGNITTSGGSRPWRTGNWGPGVITVNASATPSTISGSLAFVGTGAGPTTTFDVASGAELNVSSVIYDHPGFEGDMQLVKSGAGTMTLSGASSYTGTTTVNNGTIKIGNKNALGSFIVGRPVTQVVVNSGGAVDFNGVRDATYGFTIAGTGVGGTGALVNTGVTISNGTAQASNITLSADATIGGSGNWALLTNAYNATQLDLAGFTLTKSGANTIGLVSTTTTAGTVNIASGTLALGVTNGGSGVNGSASAFTLDDTSGANLSVVRSSSVGSLAGGGTTGGNVSLAGGTTLTAGALGTDTVYAGVISGSGNLTKDGAGTMTLTATNTNTYTGTTTVNAGTLLVNGTHNGGSDYSVAGGILGGTGTINLANGESVTSTGGAVAPGDPNAVGGPIGTLTITGNDTDSSTNPNTVEIGGPYNVDVDGANNDQLNVMGTVTLGGSASNTLNITTISAATPGSTIVIINNDGTDQVMGTFDSLPEGSTVMVGPDSYVISYVGGDGNDVVLFAGGGETHVDHTTGLLSVDDIVTDSVNNISATFDVGADTLTITEDPGTNGGNNVISTSGLGGIGNPVITRPDAYTVVIHNFVASSGITDMDVDTTGPTASVEAGDTVTIPTASDPINFGGTLDVTSETINLGEDITTGNDQTYGGAVVLQDDVTLAVGNDLEFTGTVDDDGTAGDANLTATVAGTTTLGGNIGSTNPITSLDLTTGGPLVVGVNVTAVNVIDIDVPDTAGTDETITVTAGTIASNTNDVTMTAGDAIDLQAGTIDASGDVALTADPAASDPDTTGGTITTAGTITAGNNVSVTTGDDADVVTFSGTVTATAGSVTIDTNAGNDTISSTATITTGTGVTIDSGTGDDTITFSSPSTNAAGNVTINGDTGDDTITVDVMSANSGGGVVNAGDDDDTINIGTGTLDNIAATVAVNGDAGNDALFVDDSADTDNNIYAVDGNSVDRTGGAVETTYTTIESIQVTAGTGDDQFEIFIDNGRDASLTTATFLGNTGSDEFNKPTGPANPLPNTDPRGKLEPSPVVRIHVHGEGISTGNPTSPANGDTDIVNIDMTNADELIIVDTTGGQAISADRETIRFSGMEEICLDDDEGDDLPVNIGDLYVFGTENNDRLLFSRISDTRVRLQHWNDNYGPFIMAEGAYIVAYGNDGDDEIAAALNLKQCANLHGGEGDDILQATPCNDLLYGDAGDDILQSGPGNDLLIGGAGVDYLDAAEGNDFLFGDGVDYIEFGYVGAITVTVASADEGNDQLLGLAGDDTLAGGGGNDGITGGTGNDILRGDGGNDKLSGEWGSDALIGGAGNDELRGNNSGDVLIGGTGADNLFGEFGGDLMIGGTTDFDDDTVANNTTLRNMIDAMAGQDTMPTYDWMNAVAAHFTKNNAQADNEIDWVIGWKGADWKYPRRRRHARRRGSVRRRQATRRRQHGNAVSHRQRVRIEVTLLRFSPAWIFIARSVTAC